MKATFFAIFFALLSTMASAQNYGTDLRVRAHDSVRIVLYTGGLGQQGLMEDGDDISYRIDSRLYSAGRVFSEPATVGWLGIELYSQELHVFLDNPAIEDFDAYVAAMAGDMVEILRWDETTSGKHGVRFDDDGSEIILIFGLPF